MPERQLLFDTCKGSLLHRIIPLSGEHPLRERILTFVISSLLFFVIPSIIVLVTQQKVLSASPSLKLPYLQDWNVHFMFGITLPLLVTFLLTERRLIPECLERVRADGVVVISGADWNTLKKRWESCYKVVNITSQAFGVVVGYIVSYSNYTVVASDQFRGWQDYGGGAITLPGWIFFLIQLPLFYFFAVQYLCRAVTTVWFLYRYSEGERVKLQLLHPDNAAGLGPIGSIGLRNQYVIAAGGINLALFLITMNKIDADPMLKALFIAAAMLYLIGGPVGFLGPLLPFRRSMLKEKRNALKGIAKRINQQYDKVIGDLQSTGLLKEAHEELDNLQSLAELVSKTPVWPFDLATRRRFITAYVAPVLAIFAPQLLEAVFGHLTTMLTTLFG